ncbi:hypothetical protein EAI_14972 [Harpegnathos saltator]|uniref:Uncharacterized protein n=1 Tax=Harpegnathos saltator TaxID=610380 RepID=E2C2Q8_HARSA|nr:hypothetical protein EAI_14972 [Harpegnathos saltator]
MRSSSVFQLSQYNSSLAALPRNPAPPWRVLDGGLLLTDASPFGALTGAPDPSGTPRGTVYLGRSSGSRSCHCESAPAKRGEGQGGEQMGCDIATPTTFYG